MIIKGLLSLVTSLINLIPLQLPMLPTNITDNLTTATEYLQQGLGFLRFLLGDPCFNALWVLFALIVLLEPFKLAWSLFWFVVKKIPFFGISD